MSILEKKDLLDLMKLAASTDKNSPVAYSFGTESYSAVELNDLVRDQLNELAGTNELYRENKNTVFTLIEKTIDDVLPKRVLEQYGAFADVATFAQGDKAIFTQRITNAARLRAKQFVTKVGLAGIYETFKLDGKTVEVQTMAYGGAAAIGLEEFLDGRVTFADVLDIVLLGLDEAIYVEIAKALTAAVDQLPTANQVVAAGFDEEAMDSLIAIADTYGTATVYCTFEFATKMIPAESWISENQKDAMWNAGYLANYKGHRVIVLPQSYTTAENDEKVIDPSYCWVIPAGAGNPVKVAFEGQSITREFENRDGSREIHIYKKLGVATMITNNICSYRNTALTKEVFVYEGS